MKPASLIQKLFAIERAIDNNCPPATLRAMVIEAQETALQLDLENLNDIETIRRRMETRRLDRLRYERGDGDDDPGLRGCA
jgi:hypothetical protein